MRFDFLFSSDGAMRLTRTGIARYRSRFAKAGIDARAIHSFDEFLSAMETSFPNELEAAIEDMMKRAKNKLEAELVAAVVRGDEALVERLERLLDQPR